MFASEGQGSEMASKHCYQKGMGMGTEREVTVLHAVVRKGEHILHPWVKEILSEVANIWLASGKCSTAGILCKYVCSAGKLGASAFRG